MKNDAPTWTPLDATPDATTPPAPAPAAAETAAPSSDAPTVSARVSADRMPGDIPAATPPTVSLRDPASPRDASSASAPTAGRSPARRRRSRFASVGVATVAGAGALALVIGLSGRFGVQAQTVDEQDVTLPRIAATGPVFSSPAVRARESGSGRAATFTFRRHERHPDRLFRPYLAGQIPDAATFASAPLIQPFRSFLDLMTRRQAQDDNFTVRLLDSAGENTVEVIGLDAMRRAYQQSGVADWSAVDRERRRVTDAALRRYDASGTPRSTLSARWGRADQVREARERDAPFVMHEIALADRMGMSLLVTEIGSVETFNDDRAVSTVGARSRYQMMPDLIRRVGLRRYTLPTTSGRRITVAEEWHPLFTMEPAFRLARAYANATGGEVTGVSAYHTGPGNLFSLYRAFLAHGSSYATPSASVIDDYMWGVTEGYPTVSATTSFKTYSRGYVASAYGTLRANEDAEIDPVRTMEVEEVRVRDGQRVTLSEILRVLDRPDVAWTNAPEMPRGTVYQAFRRINTHLELPVGADVSDGTNLVFTPTSGDASVRFFLPIGATEVLGRAGIGALRVSRTLDAAAFARDPSAETLYDRQYAALVLAASHLTGFTRENRAQLDGLVERFDALADQNPTPYRVGQREIARVHRSVWRTRAFEDLADAVALTIGTVPVTPRPPVTLDYGTGIAPRGPLVLPMPAPRVPTSLPGPSR